ncbi:hypothetical protein TomTYG45_12240 [Sphingobium sp. TomTYG45]
MEVPPNFITMRAICLSNLSADLESVPPPPGKNGAAIAAAADMASKPSARRNTMVPSLMHIAAPQDLELHTSI